MRILLIALSFVLISCGGQNTSGGNNGSTQDSISGQNIQQTMTLFIPLQGSYGGAPHFFYSGRQYYIGSRTSQSIRNYIYSMQGGNILFVSADQ
jgi:hypothetical protein